MGEEKDLLGSLKMELRRGTLVLSVLSQLKEPTYGYALMQTLEEKGVVIDANTLYPLMRRLEKQGLVQSGWETGGAKPRKYCSRTPYGDEVYQELKVQWQQMAAGMQQLLEEDEA